MRTPVSWAMMRSGADLERIFCYVVLASALCCLLLGPAGVYGNASAASEQLGARLPLVLVFEPAGRDDSDLTHGRAGFVRFLEEKLGYVCNTDLFIFAPRDFYWDLSSHVQVTDYIREVLAQTGAPGLDVIAEGVSGLVLRFAVETGALPDGLIRNLVMVGTPNRGTFTAELLKSALEIVRHESILEKETRSSRFLPLHELLLRSWRTDSEAIEPVSDELLELTETPWQGETEWISARSRSVYEPLYARYLMERFYALPFVPAESPKETFAGWVSRRYPTFWKSIIEANRPPALPAEGHPDSPDRLPSSGFDLSRAYYELLCMEVARNRYAMETASRASTIWASLQPYVPSDWKDAVIYYGGRLLRYYASKFLITLKAEIQEILVQRILETAGFSADPEAAMLRRLIREEVLVNLGSSADSRFQRISANHYLASFNQMSAQNSARRKTRYATIASNVTNFWAALWPQIAPNDLYCEVDCTVAPLGLRDLVAVFSGTVRPIHWNMLEDNRVRTFIASVVSGEAGNQEIQLVPGTGKAATVKASSWAPAYIRPASPYSDYQTRPDEKINVSIHLPAPPNGWCFTIWAEDFKPGDGWVGQKAQTFQDGGQVTFSLDCSGIHRIGIRLSYVGHGNPELSGGPVGSAFAREVNVPVRAAAMGIIAGGDAISAGPGGVQACEDQLPPPSGGDPLEELQESAEDGPENSPDPLSPDIPIVRVVYRSKHTTLKEASETYHARWEVDFGDGVTSVIQGQPDLQVSHTYTRPGSYLVSARSVNNEDNVLLCETAAFEASDPARMTGTFAFKSIARPRVHLVLEGPSKWVTGKPAIFKCDLVLELPPEAEIAEIRYDPGQRFGVIWERSGDFEVTCAATVSLRYRLGGQTISVKNTYLEAETVTVLTTGVTR